MIPDPFCKTDVAEGIFISQGFAEVVTFSEATLARVFLPGQVRVLARASGSLSGLQKRDFHLPWRGRRCRGPHKNRSSK
jgi:hypothetical protein